MVNKGSPNKYGQIGRYNDHDLQFLAEVKAADVRVLEKLKKMARHWPQWRQIAINRALSKRKLSV